MSYKNITIMALPIASIPVLTGEVAQRFEAEAQANYEKFLNRTPEEEKAVRERYDRGTAIVKKVLENSSLGRRCITEKRPLNTRLMYFDLMPLAEDNK